MIVVIGKSGQLARELEALDAFGELVFLGRDDIDIVNREALFPALDKLSPQAIINASAYTAVDKAESDQDAAFAINGTAVANLAAYAAEHNVHLVHVSTDYVFGGDKGSPYKVDDPYAPLGVYGESKVAGEQAILDTAASNSTIIRTSWVYSRFGNNFVKTMLRLMAEKPELGVIDDQIGSPTWAKGLAQICLAAAQRRVPGVYHYTDAGVASWYDFAVAIQCLALDKGMLQQAIPIKPIPASAYPTPAKRPPYSVMDKSNLRDAFADCLPVHWQTALESMLSELDAE